MNPGASAELRPAANSLRALWLAIAVLMLLTPLGILAAGTAWGEWSPRELRARSPHRLRAAMSPAAGVPAGLQRLSNLWTAPFPEYAPSFVRSRSFGYLLSAMFGVGFLLLCRWRARWLRAASRRRGYSSMSRGFIESTTMGFAHALTRAMLSEETAHQRGLLQSLDPRVRVVGLFALVLAVTLSRKITVVAVLFAAAVVLALFSRVQLMTLAETRLAGRAGIYRRDRPAGDVHHSGNADRAFGQGEHHGAGTAHCRAADPAGRNGGDFHHAAGFVHALGACAEVVARAAAAQGSDHDAGNDLSLRVSAGGDGRRRCWILVAAARWARWRRQSSDRWRRAPQACC